MAKTNQILLFLHFCFRTEEKLDGKLQEVEDLLEKYDKLQKEKEIQQEEVHAILLINIFGYG